MSETQSGRGGKRKGAGAPPKGDKVRVTMAVRVSPETKKTLELEKDNSGSSYGQLIDHAVEKAFPQ